VIWNLPFLAVAVIGTMGIACMLWKRNMVKIIMGLSLVESSVNLFLVALGYRQGGAAPIFTNAPESWMVMPTVQAMTLTNIVIGIATTALLLSFVIIIYRRYGTVDITEIRRLRG